MSRIYLFLPLILLSTTSSAFDLTALYGRQDGGRMNHVNTDSSLRLGQSDASGFILGRSISANRDLEIFYSRQQTELKEGEIMVPQEDLFTIDAQYLHLGGTVLSKPNHGLQGFLSGGLGITHFNPSLSGTSAENRLSMNLGIGVRWMPIERVGLRLDGRFYGTLFNSNTSLFCSGGCRLSVSGELLTQYAIFVGLVMRLD